MASLASSATIDDLIEFADFVRTDAVRRLNGSRRGELGQFFTPASVARLLASMSQVRGDCLRVLDPGAGSGMLSAAWIAAVCTGASAPRRVELTAYEVDSSLLPALDTTLTACVRACAERGIALDITVENTDFLRAGAEQLEGGLFGSGEARFDCVITNPPYKKIRTDSAERSVLRLLGIETSNLYTAFVSVALRMLRSGGELIAITPRSFCNGPYFSAFRRDLLSTSSLTNLHVFDSRDSAFDEDEVLQENVVFRIERGAAQTSVVAVDWSEDGNPEHVVRREVPFAQVVHAGDQDRFIHITPDEWGSQIAGIVNSLKGTLPTLDVSVSTGRVVDFRAKDELRGEPEPGTVPLIYPIHFSDRTIAWPRPDSRKPNAILSTSHTEGQFNPSGIYVLVKRFSSKEERRRVSAALFTPDAAPGEYVAFENHLNYFHRHGQGLPYDMARGLVAYLNSSVVDAYFRQFNGHTQVNATDLRKLRYPTCQQLERLGARLSNLATPQDELDRIVEEEIVTMPKSESGDDETMQRRIGEALAILTALGLPREQQNERSALTLLALLALRPQDRWASASNPLRGVTPIMEFAAEHYNKQYAPNTRETVRRFTLHQFQDAGLVVANPDKPNRPVNSPAFCYQVPEPVLALVRTFGTKKWNENLETYVASAGTLAAQYAREREMTRIPLRIREGLEVTLSPGGQNELIERIVADFCERFTPGGELLYIGDADEKWAFFDEAAFGRLGIAVDAHGKMPDVVVHFAAKGWLVLVEAVTSHGPVNPKRHQELKDLFSGSSAPLVFVTAFLTRAALNKYLGEIAWETEVWVAEAPTHMIHFNGERFLGPYE